MVVKCAEVYYETLYQLKYSKRVCVRVQAPWHNVRNGTSWYESVRLDGFGYFNFLRLQLMSFILIAFLPHTTGMVQ